MPSITSEAGPLVLRRFAHYAWRLGRAQLALRCDGGWWRGSDYVDWEDLVGVVEAVLPSATGE